MLTVSVDALSTGGLLSTLSATFRFQFFSLPSLLSMSRSIGPGDAFPRSEQLSRVLRPPLANSSSDQANNSDRGATAPADGARNGMGDETELDLRHREPFCKELHIVSGVLSGFKLNNESLRRGADSQRASSSRELFRGGGCAASCAAHNFTSV